MSTHVVLEEVAEALGCFDDLVLLFFEILDVNWANSPRVWRLSVLGLYMGCKSLEEGDKSSKKLLQLRCTFCPCFYIHLAMLSLPLQCVLIRPTLYSAWPIAFQDLLPSRSVWPNRGVYCPFGEWRLQSTSLACHTPILSAKQKHKRNPQVGTKLRTYALFWPHGGHQIVYILIGIVEFICQSRAHITVLASD